MPEQNRLLLDATVGYYRREIVVLSKGNELYDALEMIPN